MKSNKFNEQLNEYYDSTIPEPSNEDLNVLINKLQAVEPKAKKVNHFSTFKWVTTFVSLLLIITSVTLLAIFVPKSTPGTPEEKYYQDDDVEMVALEIDNAKNIISSQYPQYSTIFETCEVDCAFGYYTIEENVLVSIKIQLTKNDIPFTACNLQIDLTKNYENGIIESYKLNATITENENYTLYTKEVQKIHETLYYNMFEYNNYIIYLSTNFNDDEILNIFK
jgi:hypothetical protein